MSLAMMRAARIDTRYRYRDVGVAQSRSPFEEDEHTS
jgi:hypothetical protein